MTEDEITKLATQKANRDPMSYHADGCPWLISGRRQNCRCSCFSFEQGRLRKLAALTAGDSGK